MTGREVIDFVNALESAANDIGQSIREDVDVPRLAVIPLPILTQQMLQVQQSALSVRIAQQLKFEKAGWQSAIGLPSIGLPKFDKPPPPSAPSDDPGCVGTSAPEVPVGQAGASTQAPLHFEWKSGVLGDKETVGLYATFVADLKAGAAYKKGGEIKAIAELDGGVWILKHNVPLLNAMAMASARADGLDAGTFEWKVEVKLAGQSIYTDGKTYTKKGSGSKSAWPDLSFAKNWPLPKMEYAAAFPIVGPVVLEVKVGAKGDFGFAASIAPEVSLDSAKVSMTLTPHAAFKVYASAAASLAGLAKAGVEGELNLLTLDLPTTAGLELKLIDKSPFQLTETLTSELKGNALQGNLLAFAEIDPGILKAVDKACDKGAGFVNGIGHFFGKKGNVVPTCKIKLDRVTKPLVKWGGFDLSQKLLDIKAQQSPFGYGSYGPVSAPTPPALSTLLKLYWSGKREDNFITATAKGSEDAIGAGYDLVSTEGRLLAKHCPRTIPLKSYWNPQRGDNMASTTPPKDAGYSYVRIEGYVYEKPEPKTVPLKLFWSEVRGDYATVASAQAEGAAKAAGYKFVRIEGYVLPQ